MPSTVRIDCPDCSAPGAAWSTSPDTTDPAPGSHPDCPAASPAPVQDSSEPAVEQTEDPSDPASDPGGTSERVPTDDADACPTCGATGDEPCVTSSGNLASKPHAGR